MLRSKQNPHFFEERKKRAKKIVQKLKRLFPHAKMVLRHSNNWELLVAVELSAQCTDKRVNQVSPLLFKEANTPQKMTKLSIGEIENIIRPCGLSTAKSKAIWNLSKIIIEKHNGKVPQTFEELEELPGVGHKTASVVMIQAFDKSAFPVDTHIHRLMQRWGLSNGKNVVQTELDAKKLFPEKLWKKLHLQIIYFGREYCPARGHKPEHCPICKVTSPC